ncbi:MAG TPA: sigma-70 family RNA polymerase sigma factor [Rubricoccaceae bacterium]|nr:sigma-70 family RNA polymerase sigma factor [Rubricoccaceae bacterium]
MPSTSSLEQHLLRERGRLLAFIQGRVGDPELAEDILQESLLRALRAAPDLQAEEKATSWLFQIARNAITDAYRRRASAHDARARYAAEREGSGGDVMTPEDEAALCGCVADLVPTLKPEYAAVVEADLAGRDAEALAAELGITRNNLKVRRHRAHQQLRERLEQTCRLCAAHGCLDCSCVRAS